MLLFCKLMRESGRHMKRRKSEKNALFVRLCLGTATSGCSHLSKTMTDFYTKVKICLRKVLKLCLFTVIFHVYRPIISFLYKSQ